MAAGVEYTIDELAREAGTTVRSLRVYHERGILPSPQVKGRTGYYSDDHLKRVRTISRLLDRGIKLNGIRELLNAWGRGDDLGDILGVDESTEPVDEARPGATTITASQLADRFRDVPNGPARGVAAGLYEPLDATTYRIVNPDLIRCLDVLVDSGVPTADALAEFEQLRVVADGIALRTVDLVRRTALARYEASEGGAADVTEFAERVTVLRSVPSRVVADYVETLVGRRLGQDVELSAALPDVPAAPPSQDR
ncbi:MerR family transcriptional regulator [Nocardia neocaledoniensis NBRC 108232]|uniref:DNA-binding transcriptional MerR regulator n=1 Tax=Nocardia neocaledoniensis TaxID=236511 RepID=A0A317NHG9_9NOCA|nr:MerR family transcriptional regulator [Nocardia neocaledoniensis]PWV74530.1 DNA-binding transcriptional MerR regulator [Nocardia neocaledoniensis]GEM33172.1 MerR family transcriptional regulator [Nocardia neocaledoniensis NBRC 108232]